MIFKNAFRFNMNFATQARRQIKWKFNQLGAQIYMKISNSTQNVVFHVLPNIKLSQFFMAHGIDERNVQLPQGVTQETKLVQFLVDSTTAKAIQIKGNGQSLFLRNKACDTISAQIKSTIRLPDSIFQHKQQFMRTPNLQQIQVQDYLTRYYMKLQIQSYLKLKKISLSQVLSPQLKQQVMSFLNRKNQINVYDQLNANYLQTALIEKSINDTQVKINQIQQQYTTKESWYKKMAIAVTMLHLTSFGYMIFAVDWLGWDIIQPLTYTVGVVYTLLGIRFYRKYTVDRSSQNIRDALFKMLLKPAKIATLKENQAWLQIHKKQLKKNQQQQQILKNRLSFRTSLIEGIQNSIQ